MNYFYKKMSFLSIITVLLVFCLGVAVLAQGYETETVTSKEPLPQPRVVEKPVVGFLVTELTAESQLRGFRAVKNEAERRGWELISETNARAIEQQRSAFENFMTLDVDCIYLKDTNNEALRDLVIEARKRGIGVYNFDIELKPGIISNVTQANGVVGARMAYYIIDTLLQEGNVAVMNTNGHILRRRCYAAKGLFTSPVDWPNLHLVEWVDFGENWQDEAYSYAAAWCDKYGDDLDAIFAGWDTSGIFAAKAITEKGFTKDDIFVTGIDGGTFAYEMIRSGSPFVATMSQPFELYVKKSFDIMEQLQVEGVPIQESMVPKSRSIYEDPVLTTINNLPEVGDSIHSVFEATYYDPDDKDAWYNYGEQFVVGEAR
jgi:ribose transport system substrate-binding protein